MPAAHLKEDVPQMVDVIARGPECARTPQLVSKPVEPSLRPLHERPT